MTKQDKVMGGLKLVLGALVSLSCACGDDGASDMNTIDGGFDGLIDAAIPSDMTPADSALPNEPAKFALVTQLTASGDQATSYLALSDTLDSAQPLALEGAPEVLGRALGAGEPGSGVLYVGSNSAPEITRYDLQADGTLEQGASVSFQAQGVAGIGEYAAQIQLVSSTKAYYFDSRTAQIIVWDPTAMSVSKTIDLGALTIPDALLTFTSTLPVRRGAQLVMPVGWRSSNNQRVIKQAAVVVLDTDSDAVSILRDERCGYVRDSAEAADGHIYLATEAFATAVHRVNADNAPEPCLLRLKSDLTGFDETYYYALNTLAGAPSGSLLKTRTGKTFVRVLDEAAAPVDVMTVPRALASTPAWGWAEITLADTPSLARVAEAPLSPGSLLVFDTLDRRFSAEVTREGTNIREVTDGVGAVTLSTPGMTFSVAQLR